MDILVEGVHRNSVLEWFGDPAHHALVLERAFGSLTTVGDRRWSFTLASRPRPREVEWHFVEVDERHGGRRIQVELSGRRTNGFLRFSLRTMKPSSNTLVTLHAEYESGKFFGEMMNRMTIQKAFEKGFRDVLSAVKTEIESSERS